MKYSASDFRSGKMEEDKKEREAQEEDDAPSLKNVSIVGSEPIAVGSPVLL